MRHLITGLLSLTLRPFAQLSGAIQDLQVEPNIRFVTWEAFQKNYASANTFRDTDYLPLGPMLPDFELPKSDSILDEMGGLPRGLKKSVLIEREASFRFTTHNLADDAVDFSNGGAAAQYTYGLSTTINDAGATSSVFILTSITGLDTKALGYLEVTQSSVKYYAQIESINASTLAVTLANPLPVTPSNGATVKQVLRSSHSLSGNTIDDKTLLIIGTDQNGDQLVYYFPRVRMELNGRPLINFADGSGWMSLEIAGKALEVQLTEQGGSKAVAVAVYMLSGDWKLSLGPLTGLVQDLHSEPHVNVGVVEVAWKERSDSAAYNDSDWKNLGVIAPGSFNSSFTRSLVDKKYGVPKGIKVSVPTGMTAEASAELDEVNPRTLEMVYAGNRMIVEAPDAHFLAVAAGSSTTVIVQSAAGNFTNLKAVTVFRAAGTVAENRTLSAVTTGTPSITVSVALGGIPANNDLVFEGVWQQQNGGAATTTSITLDDAALFAVGDDIVARAAAGTTVATSATNDNTHIVLTSASGFATGNLVQVTDISTNKTEYAYVDSLVGTTATLSPGVSFTPVIGDLVRKCHGFSRIQAISGNNLTLSEPLASAPADNDYIGRMDSMAVTSSGSSLREISLRVVVTTEDGLKQIVTTFPRFRLKQTGGALKHPDPTSANVSAMLMGDAVALSQSFGGSTVNECARIEILRGAQKISA